MRTSFGIILTGLSLTAAVVTAVRDPRQAGGAVLPQAPSTSYARIDSALAAGRIDAETAHKYRVFAAFGDTRLPIAYQGEDSAIAEIPAAVMETGTLLRTFSPQTQAELAPFFLRPASPGSWLELSTAGGAPDDRDGDPGGGDRATEDANRGNAPPYDAGDPTRDPPASGPTATAIQWHTVSAVGGKVKVWAQLRYPGDSLKAERIAQAMSATIWPTLVNLFWAPLDDGRLDDNGGDAALDFYLVRPDFPDGSRKWRGVAMPADPVFPCDSSARYLLLDSRSPLGGPNSPGLLQVAVHEFTHAITHAAEYRNSDCWEYAWIDEATASWSEHKVYPRANSEHPDARFFLGSPRESLDHYDELDKHQYGAYLLPFYLALKKHEQALPSMWRQFKQKSSLDGIDAALRVEGTTLDSLFPEFAVANLNRPPADDYRTEDALQDVAFLKSDSVGASVPPGGHYEKKILMNVHYLATQYSYFVFDTTVRSVTFENTLTPVPFAAVWGIEKIRGQWQKPADWSRTRTKTWCRNEAAEDLEQLILVFTNTQWKDKQLQVEPRGNWPLVRAFATGCSAWVGTVTATYTGSFEPYGTLVETAIATVRFEPDPDLTAPGEPVTDWMAVSGRVEWTARASGGQCTGSHTGSTPILPGYPDGSRQAILRIADDGDGLRHTVSLGPWPEAYTPLLAYTCADGTVIQTPLLGAMQWWNIDPAGQLVSPDGKSLSGTYAMSLGDATMKWTWTFRVQ